MKYVIRLSSLTALFLATVAGSALFWVSQQVQQLEREQRQIEQSIAQEKEAHRVLMAEWDYLNRPDRLEALAERHLQMTPVTPTNLIQNANAIPEPKLDADSDDDNILDAAASTKEKPSPKKKSPTKSPKPVAVKADSLPIRDAHPTAQPDFGNILNNLSGSDDAQ